MNTDDKPRMVQVTDPAEIESIRRNGLDDIIGGEVAGQWWAYKWSLDRWRAADKATEGRL
jgi:hypothetical protein